MDIRPTLDDLPAPIASLTLFLDFDGTLVPIADRPDAVAVSPGLPDLLDRAYARLDGRLVIVSGRTIADLDNLIGSPIPAVAGSHGMEIRIGDAPAVTADEPIDLGAIEKFLAARLVGEGVLIETKAHGVAIHYRLAPGRRDEAEMVAGAAADRFSLRIKPGKMVVELVAPGHDKGDAVREIMERAEFAGSVPVYIGDDVTDEDGFRAASALGGTGILVGEREGTAAEQRLADVEAVRRLLEAIAGSRP